MIKQMMKLAGARDEKHFLEMFPRESDFIKKHGGEMLYMYGGGYYADGGMAPEEAGMQQGQPQEQGGGGQDQMQQLVQFVAQALQQGMQPEEIVQKLVEAGLPEDQAAQLVQAVIQQMQGGGDQGGGQPMPAQGPQEEMMEGPQGQEPPPQEMAEGQAPMGRYGGAYAYGGPTRNNSTYYQGMSYAQGGPFIPQYGDIAWNVDYATGGEAASGAGNELAMQVAQLLQQGVQPEAILQQLVKAKVPQKKAVKLIQVVMQKLQQAGGAPAADQGGMEAGGGMMAFGGPTYSKVTQYNHQGIVPALDWMGYGGDNGPYPVVQTTTKYPGPGLYEPYRNNEDFYRGYPRPSSGIDKSFGNTTYPAPRIPSDNMEYMNRVMQRNLEQMRQREMENYINKQRLNELNNYSPQYSIDPKTGGTILKNKKGGSVKYKKGGEYEMSHDDIQKLIQQGYKIQYL